MDDEMKRFLDCLADYQYKLMQISKKHHNPYVISEFTNTYSMFHVACRKGFPTILDYLLENQEESKRKDILHTNYTILYIDETDALLKIHSEDCKKNGVTDSWSLFHHACIQENIDIVKTCIRHGADIHQNTNHGKSPIFLAACFSKNPDIVQYLLEQGGDPWTSNFHKYSLNIKYPYFASFSWTAVHGAFARVIEEETLTDSCASIINILLYFSMENEKIHSSIYDELMIIVCGSHNMDLFDLFVSKAKSRINFNCYKGMVMHPLYLAISNVEMTRKLIELGSRPSFGYMHPKILCETDSDSQSTDVDTELYQDASQNVIIGNIVTNHIDIVKLLLESEPIEFTIPDQIEVYIYVCIQGTIDNNCPEILGVFLEHLQSIWNPRVDTYDYQPFSQACIKELDEIARILLGYDINYKEMDDESATPLHHICNSDQVKMKNVLLTLLQKPNIMINAKDQDGYTPLFYAIKNRNIEFVKILLDHPSMDTSVTTENRSSPLHFLIRKIDTFHDSGNTESIHSLATLIIQKSPELVFSVDENGYLPIHLACEKGQSDLVQLLIHYKSPIQLKTKMGYTPLDLALQHGFYDLGRILFGSSGSLPTQSADASRDIDPTCLICRDPWKNPHGIVTVSGLRIYCKTCIDEWFDLLRTQNPVFTLGQENKMVKDPLTSEPIIMGPIPMFTV